MVEIRQVTFHIMKQQKKQSTGNAAYREYQFTILEDGTLVNKMKYTSSYIDANVIIRLKKSNGVISLYANTPYYSTRTDNFICLPFLNINNYKNNCH